MFKDLWVTFVKEFVGKDPSPILYQYVTHEVFKLLAREKFRLESSAVITIF